MQHFIFTKFNMPGFKGNPHMDPEWIEGRIELFKKWLLPSMKQQTCQDFRWFMHVWGRTPDKQAEKLFALQEEYDKLELLWICNREDWHVEWLRDIRNRVEPGDLWTSRIDSDDAVHKAFVEMVQGSGVYAGNYLCFGNGIMHNTQTGKCFQRNYYRNPFLSYHETSYRDAPKDIVTVHNRQHCHAEPISSSSLETPMWLQNVHGGNRGNKFSPGKNEIFNFSEISKDFIGE